MKSVKSDFNSPNDISPPPIESQNPQPPVETQVNPQEEITLADIVQDQTFLDIPLPHPDDCILNSWEQIMEEPSMKKTQLDPIPPPQVPIDPLIPEKQTEKQVLGNFFFNIDYCQYLFVCCFSL